MGFKVTRSGNKKSVDPLLGIPSDKSWEDGFFDEWQPETKMNDAIDDISELLKLLAPEKPDGLAISGNANFLNAKISDSNIQQWYIAGKTPGELINNYVVTSNLILTTLNQAEAFYTGKFVDPTSYGILELLKDDIQVSEYNMSDGIGDNGIINITSIEQYNKLWAKGNANATTTLVDEGYNEFKMIHTNAGESNIYSLYFDPTPGDLAFESIPILAVITPVIKMLSGIEYLTIGTVISVSFVSLTGIFQHAYHATNVATVDNIAINKLSVNPDTVPLFSDVFEVTNLETTLELTNKADNNPKMEIKLYRPEKSITELVDIPGRICTYPIVSTCLQELFFDEDKRVINDTTTLFDSTLALANGDAQVNNGRLEYGLNDYPSKTGDQEYQRHFCKTAAATGFIDLQGINYTDVAPYGTGDINVLLKLDNDNLYYDLGRVVGDKNGSGSGTDRANSIGGQVNGSGSQIQWSIGTNSTAYNNQQYRIIIIFKNNNKSLTKIITT